MNARAVFFWLVVVFSSGLSSAVPMVHPVPKDRAKLTAREWFPFVFSKVSPLEWWSFAESRSDIRRDDYPSEMSYELAKQNTWEFPRFCYSLFRAKPQIFAAMFAAVEEYQGDVVWVAHDDCVAAFPSKPQFYSSIVESGDIQNQEPITRASQAANLEFVHRAMADVPKFAAYLEKRLGLEDKFPVDFDPQWLTREGLSSSRGPFEDYVEPGDWSVFLARNPQKYADTSQPTSPLDQSLPMGIRMSAQASVLAELNTNGKADWHHENSESTLLGYPLLSRLSDISSDVVYGPDEVQGLLEECLKAQAAVKHPGAIRELDNLVRIARRAQKLQLGIYFGGQ